MFIELVDALRCPVPHEESWLVASSNVMEARHIVEGRLGCPVCSAQYPIHRGVVDFRQGVPASSPPLLARGNDMPDDALRLAALLDLSDALGFALLLGEWGSRATQLAGLVDVPLLLVDPPHDVTGAPGISVVRCDGSALVDAESTSLPIAAGAARAVAIDVRNAGRIASAIRATRPGGRVVASVHVAVPAEVRELARDGTVWVGEREAPTSPLVSLHVRRGQG